MACYQTIMTRRHSSAEIGRRSLTLQADGVALNALCIEPAALDPAVPALVFLHEGLGSITQWTGRGIDVPAQLAAATGGRALVYDRQGYGLSDPLTTPRHPRYLHDEAWQVLPAVLDAAGIDRAVLIGHSDGGSIALLFAAEYPGHAAGVVCEAAHVIVEDVTLDGIRAARGVFESPRSRLKTALGRHHGDRTDAVFAAWADAWLSPEFAAFDLCDQLPRISAPVLAIQGDGDEYRLAPAARPDRRGRRRTGRDLAGARLRPCAASSGGGPRIATDRGLRRSVLSAQLRVSPQVKILCRVFPAPCV